MKSEEILNSIHMEASSAISCITPDDVLMAKSSLRKIRGLAEKELKALEKRKTFLDTTIKFIYRVCFEGDPILIDDCQLQVCKVCGKKAWLVKDIEHSKKCEIGIIIKELKEATA